MADVSIADRISAWTLARTILPPEAAAKLDGVAAPSFGPENEFGCR
jgi:hypothetical protein